MTVRQRVLRPSRETGFSGLLTGAVALSAVAHVSMPGVAGRCRSRSDCILCCRRQIHLWPDTVSFLFPLWRSGVLPPHLYGHNV